MAAQERAHGVISRGRPRGMVRAGGGPPENSSGAERVHRHRRLVRLRQEYAAVDRLGAIAAVARQGFALCAARGDAVEGDAIEAVGVPHLDGRQAAGGHDARL